MPPVKKTRRNYYLEKNYGLSDEARDVMRARQGNRCARPECGKSLGRIRCYVNKDLITGAVRGLMHRQCDQMLRMQDAAVIEKLNVEDGGRQHSAKIG